MISANLSAIFYLISGVLFILALRGLSSPETSRQGNFFGILGMVIAITVTFLIIGNFSSGFLYVILFRNLEYLKSRNPEMTGAGFFLRRTVLLCSCTSPPVAASYGNRPHAEVW